MRLFEALATGAFRLTLLWLTVYSIVVARAGDVLRRPRIRRTLEGLTGTVLVAFGLELATEHR